MAKDLQRSHWMMTLNNPLDSGFDHTAIKKTLVENFPTVDYFAMVDEQGSTFHTHVFSHFTSRVRFSKIKKYFPTAHIDAVKGTASECITYLKKDGKWLDDASKQEQKIEGSFEEWGKVPPDKGRKSLTELYELVKAGYNNAEIIAENQDYILMLDKIDLLRTTLLTEKYKNHRRLNLKVIYSSGDTGKGKSRDILDKHGDANVYRVTEYKHPFDGYACQSVISFEEYRSQFMISDILNYCDIYPIQLPARYANKYMCADTIYITSNWPLEEQYRGVQVDSPDTWKAFLRRIHEVRIYHEDGTVTVYDSVDKYMNRDIEFHTMTEGEQLALPFKEEGEVHDA